MQAHPIAAALWTVTYEVMLVTTSFVAGVAGPVRVKWEQHLSESLYQASRRLLSTFDRRYCTYVADRWESVDQRGLATGGFFTPALDDVFIDVSLTHRPPHAVPGDPLGDVPAGITERHSIWDFLNRPSRVLLAIVGGPGSGKTTLLRYTARQLCRRRRPGHLAVMLFLRDHAAAIAASPTTTLPDRLRMTLPPALITDEPDQWLERRLAGGNCVVLLDGLDEIAEAGHRKAVADWVEQQVPFYPKCSFVVTSRPHGYEASPLNGFAVLQTRRLTDEQVRHFVHSWYLAAEKYSRDTNAGDVTMHATEKADDLLNRLRRNPALLDLTYNPLLLTMIANVHRYRSALPGSRAELYKEICEVLLWRRHEAKGLHSQLRGEQQIAVLRKVAFHMMQRRLRDLTHADILRIIEEALPHYSRDIAAAEFLTLVRNNGLLVERENGSYAFAHLTFQEYLAAVYIHETPQANLLASAVGDTWWRETILLYTAQADATDIVQACLNADTLPALALAFDCAATARSIAPEYRRKLGLLMTEEITTTDFARRRLLAGVAVVRQLHTAIPVERGGRVCTEPVARAVYELFLGETQNDKRSWPPTAPAEPDLVATTGPWSRDAISFIDWLNEHICTEQPVRLPTVTELAHLPGNHLFRPAWAVEQSAPETATLWLPPGAPRPVSLADLHHHLKQDLQSLARLLPVEAIHYLNLLNLLDLDWDRNLAYGYTYALALALDLTVVRNQVRTLDLARDLSHALARDLARRLDLTRTRARDLTRHFALASNLTRDLTHARDLARDLDLNLDRGRATRALDLARARDVALDLALARALELGRALDRAHARALDLARHCARHRDLDRDLHCALIRYPDLALDRDLALDIDNALDLDIDLSRALNLNLEWVSRPTVDRVGVLLSKVINGYRDAVPNQRKDRNTETEINQIVFRFLLETPTTFDRQADELLDAIKSARDEWPARTWSIKVADRLLATARPVLHREQPVTTHLATIIRLPALFLAVEAEHTLSAPELGAKFRELVATITLLERYTTGQQSPCETILLAEA